MRLKLKVDPRLAAELEIRKVAEDEISFELEVQDPVEAFSSEQAEDEDGGAAGSGAAIKPFASSRSD